MEITEVTVVMVKGDGEEMQLGINGIPDKEGRRRLREIVLEASNKRSTESASGVEGVERMRAESRPNVPIQPIKIKGTRYWFEMKEGGPMLVANPPGNDSEELSDDESEQQGYPVVPGLLYPLGYIKSEASPIISPFGSSGALPMPYPFGGMVPPDRQTMVVKAIVSCRRYTVEEPTGE